VSGSLHKSAPSTGTTTGMNGINHCLILEMERKLENGEDLQKDWTREIK
jgi:hypothetical protein